MRGLVNGLQNRLAGFDSRSDLTTSWITIINWLFCLVCEDGALLEKWQTRCMRRTENPFKVIRFHPSPRVACESEVIPHVFHLLFNDKISLQLYVGYSIAVVECPG